MPGRLVIQRATFRCFVGVDHHGAIIPALYQFRRQRGVAQDGLMASNRPSRALVLDNIPATSARPFSSNNPSSSISATS